MTRTTTTPWRAPGRDRFPGKALIGLFLAGVVGILTECLPAGLLPQMSSTLHTDVALTGQTVTVYALATALAAIPLTRVTARWPRKNVLQLALTVVVITDVLTALSSDYVLTLVIRFLAGLGTALIWPLLGGYGARLTPRELQGRAVAIALAGTPVSLALGIPLGSWIGSITDWQVAFYLAAAITALTMLWVLLTLPNLSGQPTEANHSIRRVLAIPGLRTILFALAAYMVAHNVLYTYITDFLGSVGMAEQVGWVLFAFGVTSILSVVVVGSQIDHHLRVLVVASTLLFGVSVLILSVLAGIPALVYAAAAAWGLAFGSSPSLFIHAAITATREAADVAQSIAITVFSGSIAVGGLVGGLVITGLGGPAITWTSLVLLVAAAIAVVAGKRHAFPEEHDVPTGLRPRSAVVRG